MKYFLLYAISQFILPLAAAQSSYNEAMQQGDAAVKNGQYETAINKYFAAEAFDPGKKNEVKEKIRALFKKINDLKDKAEEAQAEAEKQTKIVKALDLQEKAKTVLNTDPTLALRLAEASMKLARLPENTTFAENTYKENNFYKIVGRKTDKVAAAVFSPDGKMILVGNLDNTARLWGIDGKLIREFKGHTGALKAVAFSADGKMILTGAADKTARLWNLDGTMLYEFKGHTDSVTAVAFSPDMKTILTADKTVHFWKTDGTIIHETLSEKLPVNSLDFSSDGSRILMRAGKACYLLNDDGAFIEKFGSPGGGSTHPGLATFFTREKLIMSFDGSFRITDYNGEPLQNPASVTGAKLGFVSNTAFGSSLASCDGVILIGQQNGVVSLFCPLNLDTKFIGHKGNINAITISPDGKKILTVSDDLTARIWQLDWKYVSDDFNNSGVVIKLPSNRQTTTFTNRFLKDQRILVTGFDGNVISESMRRADEINPPAFSTDGKTVVTGSLENILSSQGVDEKIIAVFKRQKNLADIVAFSPDGKKMLTSAFDSVACMWGADGEMIKEFKHNSKIKSIAFSPDGKNILTGSLNGIARLWALDGTMMREFKHPDISFQKKGLLGVKRETIKQSIDYVAFSSSGDTILTGSANKIRLWALDSSLLKEFDLDRSEFAKFVSFSPDGNMILTASNDSIRLWDTNGKLNGKFKINVSSLNALAFSADGKRIIICADDFGHTISDRLPLQDFLNSNQLEPLSAEQKKQFGITDITDSKPQQIKIPKK